MKARELMLGDWVQCAFGFGKIVHIGNPYIIVFIDFINGKERMMDASFFHPIPITAEILKKNGFTNGEFYAESHIEDWQIMSDGSHLAARSERGWCIDIPCRYVHELQHALKLCGIEKEIEL